MFIILVYDIKQKRVGKILKICRKYLTHVQKSVFEGSITNSKLKKLKLEIERVVVFDEDSVVIYTTEHPGVFLKEQIGVVEEHSNII